MEKTLKPIKSQITARGSLSISGAKSIYEMYKIPYTPKEKIPPSYLKEMKIEYLKSYKEENVRYFKLDKKKSFKPIKIPKLDLEKIILYIHIPRPHANTRYTIEKEKGKTITLKLQPGFPKYAKTTLLNSNLPKKIKKLFRDGQL